jgi:hypothetical protein
MFRETFLRILQWTVYTLFWLLPRANQNCLRCANVKLRRLPGSTFEIRFFACPRCHRQYAKKPETALTFRWLHPVTLPLYAVLFEVEPLSAIEIAVIKCMKGRSRKELCAIVDEIDLELESPTQNIREILDNLATEEKCRDFLRAFVTHVRLSL